MKLDLNSYLLLTVLLGTRVNLSACKSANDGKVPRAKQPNNAAKTKEQKHDTSNIEEYNQRLKANRKRWKQIFSEIKTIVVDIKPEQKSDKSGRRERKLFDQWKLFREPSGPTETSDSSPHLQSQTQFSADESEIVKSSSKTRPNGVKQRFDGFKYWDNLLQQWADEAGEDLKDTQDRNSSGTKFSPSPAKEGEAVLPHTDIGDKSKKIWIVTTASLPWMTGTAVNPLLRAAFMTTGRKEAGGKVTLMLPWLEKEIDRDKIYGKDRSFDTSDEQEEWIRTWLKETAGLAKPSEDLNIAWYIGRHETQENSIYSMGDITAMIPEEEVDICVLEEPEHLNWYRAPGESWTSKFRHVVGIVHTNYFVYAMEQPAAYLRAPGMRLLASWMCRAHCHRIIKLSGTLENFAPEKELIENVHGVRNTFLDYGVELSKTLKTSKGPSHPVFGPNAEPKVYFIGKMLWSKGIGSLMELLQYAEESADLKIDFDMYGGGPNFEDAKEKSAKLGLSMTFHGPVDHAALADTHKIFVNPSLSEVLCTTVAEALAMGKFVVVPSHPSNDFFAQFPNCLTYANKEEFVANLYYALTHSPEPLSEECAHALSWEAANERFAAAGCITEREAEEFNSLLASDEGGIEIGLPPLIENEKRREQLSRTVKNTRTIYREFRSNLAQEIRQSKVLPEDIQNRMLTELDKRLGLDVDELLASPKLKLQLSPAELDRQLLDLYKTVTDNPSSDFLRTALGGSQVGRQAKYLKQQASKEKARARMENGQTKPAFPQFLDDAGDGDATKWIKQTLRRNLQPTQNHSTFQPQKKDGSKKTGETKRPSNKKDSPTMMVSLGKTHYHRISTRNSFPSHQKKFTRLSSRVPPLLI